MSENRMITVLLPGATTDADELSATVAAVRAEAGEDAEIVAVRADAGSDGGAFSDVVDAVGIPRVDADRIVEDATLIAFARIGDRWRPGTLLARRRPLEAHPSAVISIAGHHRVPRHDGEAAGLVVPAPLPPQSADTLRLRTQVEASAVLVRSTALDAAALELLQLPHGDGVVWARVVGDHGHLPSGEIAADVRLDPRRHGFRSEARIETLLDAVTDPRLGDEEPEGTSVVRRELLRRLFIETNEMTEVDVGSWIGPAAAASPRAAAVVADLQWALQRQREALVAERVRWPEGRVTEDEAIPAAIDLERIRLSGAIAEFGIELRVRDAQIQRLEAELARRDRDRELAATKGEDA
ncbi:MAG: hypothetical protein ITG02_07985 [Patulibacter sp.]|nr:hypothetical protein [Patulibacter sp.]